MGLFSSTPEERAAKDEKRRQAEAAAAEKEFRATPAGQALTARDRGETLFQIAMPLSTSKAQIAVMISAFTTTREHRHVSTLEAIEAQGWRLDHVGYVFRETGSESRDKFLASGQQVAVSGEIVGVYLFRVVEPAERPKS